MGELLASMSSRELSEWMAYFRLSNEQGSAAPPPPPPDQVAAKVKEWAMSQVRD